MPRQNQAVSTQVQSQLPGQMKRPVEAPNMRLGKQWTASAQSEYPHPFCQ